MQIISIFTLILVVIFLVWAVRFGISANRRVSAEAAEIVRKKYAEQLGKYERSLALAADPPPAPFALGEGEAVVFTGHARRDYDAGFTSRPSGYTTRTSGNIGGAVVGGVLFGPVGAIVGAAGSTRSVTESGPNVTEGVHVADEGTLTITNQRVMFLGEAQTLEITQSAIIQSVVKHVQGSSWCDVFGNVVTKESSTAIRFRRPDEPPNEVFTPRDGIFLAAALKRSGVDVSIPAPPITAERLRLM